jgi:hypothetical protein
MKVKGKNPSKLRRRKKSAPNADSSATTDKAASDRFVQDLVVRGEAAEVGKDGKLPSQATHAITKKNPDGTVQVKRARYKLV